MYQEILFNIENNIAIITFNRPNYGNAFSEKSYEEIIDALSKCSNDESVRAVVVTGNGKTFSAGGDILEFKEYINNDEPLPVSLVVKAGNMTKAVRNCLKPVIAMINGAAAGAGFSFAMSCDFRVMSEKSKFVTSFIGLGFPGDSGLMHFLNNIIGLAKTTELFMLSKPISSNAAYELGLCNIVAEEGTLEEVTMKLVQELALKPTKAISYQKKLMNEFFFDNLTEFNKREAEYMSLSSRTEDHQEAVNAFLEKRAPEFKGK